MESNEMDKITLSNEVIEKRLYTNGMTEKTYNSV